MLRGVRSLTGSAGRTRRLVLAMAGMIACVTLASGCAIGIEPDPELITATSPDGRGAIRPIPAPTNCTKTVTDVDTMVETMEEVEPGDRVCLLGNLRSRRLVLKRSGTANKPIELVGDGWTILRGIDVEASNIRISGVNVVRPHGPGVYLLGNNNTFENNTVLSPRKNDGDGMRFFGHNVTIRHNTIRDTAHLNGAHADCMQTYSTDEKHIPSQYVRITDNRCERISNICLIAEGPNSSAGDGAGIGRSSHFLFANNYCENHASQATMLDDVQYATIVGNEIYGRKDKAFAFDHNSTHGFVANNKIGPLIDYEVGADESSKVGYRGTPIGGKP